jgi:hypothetical protein
MHIYIYILHLHIYTNLFERHVSGRIRELAERYATPLPKLTEELETLSARVDEHLKKMGASWK